MVLERIEKHLGLFLFVAMFIGLIFPQYTSFLVDYIAIFLGIALFFIFLKVDLSGIKDCAKKPLLFLYIIIMSMVVIPSVLFLLLSPFDIFFATAVLLLFAAPTAATIAVLVDLFKGDVPFALFSELIMYIIAPFTLPFLVYFFLGNIISVDIIGIAMTMTIILIIPMIAAQVVKRIINTKPVNRYTSTISILILSINAMAVLGKFSTVVIDNAWTIALTAVFLLPIYLIVSVIGYYMAPWIDKKKRISISAMNTFMNGSLILVIVTMFFSPEVLFVLIANAFSWHFVLGAAKYIKK